MAGPRAVALAVLTALALAACGEKPEPDLSDIPAPKPSASAGPSAITITAKGDREAVVFTVEGSASAGTVRVTLRNQSARPTTGRMVRADGDHSPAQVAAELGHLRNGRPLADWFHDADGPSLTSPGKSQTTTLELVPGTYYVVGDQPLPDRPASFRIDP